MIEKIKLLRNVGSFDDVSPDTESDLKKLSLIYAENGRGKTTLANILRSFGDNNPSLIEERHRLGVNDKPHIVIDKFVYQNGGWQSHNPNVFVFDDYFVAQNVCSGVDVSPGHRQNLHELIIGAEGVKLNSKLQVEIKKNEEHNRVIREKEEAITPTMRRNYSVVDFCNLQQNDNIENAILDAQRNIEVAQSSEAIKNQNSFQTIELPVFDLEEIEKLLQKDLPALQQAAATKVKNHLSKLGDDAEAWVGEGVKKSKLLSGDDSDTCPFCAQALENSPIIVHYEGYFSDAYTGLKDSIITQGRQVSSEHGADIQLAFERSIQSVKLSVIFWQKFADISAIEIDTAEVVGAWNNARESVLAVLRSKLDSPLEKMTLTTEIRNAVVAYEKHRINISNIFVELQAYNSEITLVKERAAVANLPNLNSALDNLKVLQTRYRPEVNKLCQAYLDERAGKKITEKNRNAAREKLNSYREEIFATYQESINKYLGKFLAGFRLQNVTPQNNRSGTSCDYDILINDIPVPINDANNGPSFRNTLSAGDRSTLALAFFFSSLDRDTDSSEKIIIIDDPITSLDEHRSLHTIEQIIGLSGRVNQIIVLSHSKPFLCQIWDNVRSSISDKDKNAIHILRSGTSSDIKQWDVNQDCITEHDKRYTLIKNYLDNESSNKTGVAVALRPTLESFIRVAYPVDFPPGTVLGNFIGKCKEHNVNILNQDDIEELSELTKYANKFHHNTNPTYATETINDQTLLDYCKRVLAFTSRPLEN